LTFFLVGGLCILIYRPLQFYSMRNQYASKTIWEKKWGGNFESKYRTYERLIISISAFSFIAALCAFLNLMIIYFNST